jgi:glycosyltransferase involved in cell wall biosynthesis
VNNSPKFSVIIPSFNKKRFIRITLDSIFRQNYPNLEVIIQDGGSTDGTVAILKEFKSKYPDMIKFETKKDAGQLGAILEGIKKASGDIVTFINADDKYLGNIFSTISNVYKKNDDALWYAGQGIVINEKENEIVKSVSFYKNVLLAINSYNLLLATNYLIQPAVFINKKAYKKYGPFTGTKDFVTEYDLWLKLGREKMPYVIREPVAAFRIEPSTTTKRLSDRLLKEDYKIVQKYTNSTLLLFIHNLNNLGRKFVGKFV